MTTLVLSFVFTASLSFVIAFHFTRPKTASKSVVKRLNIIYRPANSADVELITLSQKTRNLADALSEGFAQYEFARHLTLLILYAGSTRSVGYVLLQSCGAALVAGALAMMFGAAVAAIIGATCAGALVPYLLLRRKEASRLHAFNEALPDAIDLMARALRAGHSSASSIEIIAEQSPPPLSDEFGRCFQQQKFGIPFREALIELGERIPSKDLHFLITAILVQKETGGDLTQILDRATNVIRERIRIEGEVRSYTAQGRLTGWILSAFPLGMYVLINLFTPGYTHVLFVDPIGQKLIYAGVGLIATGAFIISKIVDVKV